MNPGADLPALESVLPRRCPGTRWVTLLVPGVLAAAGAAALLVDLPLAKWFLAGNVAGPLERLLTWGELYGHGLGVVLIAWVIYHLDPPRRRALPRVLVTAFGAGLAADVVKLLVARVRPKYFDFAGGVLESFGPLLPLGRSGSSQQSFPSAHVATAVGLTLALLWLYPRGRWVFATLVVLVSCQRLDSGAHFLSDVFFGASLGWLVAKALLPGEECATWLTRPRWWWRWCNPSGP